MAITDSGSVENEDTASDMGPEAIQGKGGNAHAKSRKKGKSVDEAIKLALEEMGVGLEDVAIEVLEEPSRGILGIIGSKPALVRVEVKPARKVGRRQT